MKPFDQPFEPPVETISGGKPLASLSRRSPGDLIKGLLAVWRARWYLRGAQVLGPYTRVWGRVHVRNQGRMHIGDHTRLIGTITPIELGTGSVGCLEIGDDVFINYGSSIAAMESIRIGARCLIGTYTIILDNNFHRIEPEWRDEMPDSAPVVLEENVWLGARAIVLPGVTIGHDSVVGAGSVVTRSIPPRSLAAGVPARVLKDI